MKQERKWPPETRPIRRYRNIVIQGACNLRCDYCEVKDAKVDVPATIDSLERILSRFDPDSVLFKVETDGEITLYPRILDYLEAKACQGYSIEVLSNGTRLPRALNGRDHLLWTFSLDGHTAAMNARRGLSQKQVDEILTVAVDRSAELQCVFHDQTIDEMNGFIDWLSERNYRGALHIFPLLALEGAPLQVWLDYEKLHKAPFLPPEEFFRRWRHVYQSGARGQFVCDQITNGYNFHVAGSAIQMTKCDCYAPPRELYHSLGEEREYRDFPCGTCVSHQEYNNSRSRMAVRRRLPVL